MTELMISLRSKFYETHMCFTKNSIRTFQNSHVQHKSSFTQKCLLVCDVSSPAMALKVHEHEAVSKAGLLRVKEFYICSKFCQFKIASKILGTVSQML